MFLLQKSSSSNASVPSALSNTGASSNGLKIPFVPKVPTPVNSLKLGHYLHGYNLSEKKFLIDSFTQGFRIPISGKIKKGSQEITRQQFLTGIM